VITVRHEDAVTTLAAASNWHKSSHSDGPQNGCVEVGSAAGLVGVRDTTLAPASPILAFPDTAWSAFLTALRGD
jgi:Domain of unknown function (DUF397)